MIAGEREHAIKQPKYTYEDIFWTGVMLGVLIYSSHGFVGTTTAVSIGAIAVGAVVWYLKKVKQNKVVTCGVQNNENRLF